MTNAPESPSEGKEDSSIQKSLPPKVLTILEELAKNYGRALGYNSDNWKKDLDETRLFEMYNAGKLHPKEQE